MKNSNEKDMEDKDKRCMNPVPDYEKVEIDDQTVGKRKGILKLEEEKGVREKLIHESS